MLSERRGFDLVTFQDHPYQPGFHDTWTLLSWVAARTSRIHVAGNVLNLPLRQPAVLARAAASLDLLSGGRVELGLGAGGFWDAIEAMGGRRLTPGQGVDALSEAIDIIRGIWDPHRRAPLRAGGRWHRVDGAKPGPAPAHEIPIWLGAYKPRMLRLTGRKADGWLPSLPYLEPGALAAGNQAIDDAAREAGRDPREITRLLNVTPQVPAEELARMAVEDGVSVFIIASDDDRTIESFAAEVMPAVREQVDRERSRGGVAPTGRVRGEAARALRAPGIAYDEVPATLADATIEPGDLAYGRYRSTYLRGGAPGLVLAPRTIDQLRDAVAFARDHRHLPLGVLSAGHGISGRSINEGGLVLDVGAFDEVTVLDPSTGRVRVGPGARWGDVARALAPHGLAISSGDFGGVGVGGLATAGGIGWFAREHGLTIDRMRSVDVVLADGRLIHATEADEPDLFWAMRGAGANFGVAVSFEFEASRVGRLGFAQLTFDATDTAEFLEGWGSFIERADRVVSGEAILSPGWQGGRRAAQVLLVVDNDDPEQITAHLQPIAQIAPLVDQSVTLVTYDQLMGAFPDDGPQRGQGEPVSRSGLLRRITPGFARAAHALLDAGATHFLAVRAVGGAVSDVPAEATAYGWRDAGFSVAAFGSARSGLDEQWHRLLPFFEGMYLSFDSTTPPPVERAFPPAHLRRLRELKRRYDPTGLFRDNFFIDPAAEQIG